MPRGDESCFHALCELGPKKEVSHDSDQVTQLDTTENKATPVSSVRDKHRSWGVPRCFSSILLLAALANLSPTASVTAGGVGASLPAPPAGFQPELCCVSTSHTSPQSKDRATLWRANFDVRRIKLVDLPKTAPHPSLAECLVLSVWVRCFVKWSAGFAEPAIRRKMTFPECTCC